MKTTNNHIVTRSKTTGVAEYINTAGRQVCRMVHFVTLQDPAAFAQWKAYNGIRQIVSLPQVPS